MAPSSAHRREFSYRTRQSTWESLRARQSPLDVLIVGGGIVGAGLLRELALRELTDVLLVEKNDFASGTSGASSKLVHAGIRYLEQAWNRLKEGRVLAAIRDFNFVVQASRERDFLRRMAPHLVHSKQIHLVLAAGDGRSKFSVLAGVWLYYLIQCVQGQTAPRPRAYFSPESIKAAAPELDDSKVRAMYTFSDSETDDARLVIENLQDASDHGASAMNYVELVSFSRETDLIDAVLRNRETGEERTVSARVLINASGPFVDEVAARGARRAGNPFVDRVAGAHIDVYPPVTDRSFYITASDGRLVFVLCRQEDGLLFSRIGTTERPLKAQEPSDSPQASREELRYLLDLTKQFFPDASTGPSNIIGTDAGIRALRARGGERDAFQKSREHDIIPEGRIYHVVGVKLTDYRRVAVEIIDTVDWAAHGVEIAPTPPATPLRPVDRGSRMYAESLAETIVRYTMPVHWDDVALRRLGALPRALRQRDPEALERLFDDIAAEMGWDADRAADERRRFTPPVLP